MTQREVYQLFSECKIIYDAIAAGKIPGVKLDDQQNEW